jgi:hypothetical protein
MASRRKHIRNDVGTKPKMLVAQILFFGANLFDFRVVNFSTLELHQQHEPFN